MRFYTYDPEPRPPQIRADGANIRVVSPSFPSLAHASARLERALKAMENLGYRISFGATAFDVSPDGFTAGSPQARAEDLVDAFEDPDVDIVLSAMAGAHSHELIPYLDRRSFKTDRPFFGHSDNGILNAYLLSQCGLTSFYAVGFLNQFGEAGEPYESFISNFQRALSGQPLVLRPAAKRTSEYYNWMDPEIEGTVRRLNWPGGWTWLQPGEARGRLVGADLETLTLSAQMGLWQQQDGDILFWDVAPTALRTRGVDDVFAAALKHIDWALVGATLVGPNPYEKPGEWARHIGQIMRPYMSREKPVVVNADVGHLDPVWPTPYGAHAFLSSELDCLRVEQPCLRAEPAAEHKGA